MELTLDQALQKGIEAHKAGRAQEADRYYTAILKANPKHPDANHNMGVLAVGVGKAEAALPFFKTALEANSGIDQYWLSYIDTLIKLGRIDDAKAAFEQAKSKIAKEDGFDKLETRLIALSVETKENVKGQDETNILNTLKPDQAIKLAKKKAKEGSSEKAKRIYLDILDKFPKNKKAIDELKALAGETLGMQEPSNDQLQSLANLYTQGQYQQVQTQASKLLKKFSNSVTLYNILGAVNQSTGRLGEAIEAYKKAIAIKPDYADAYYNMGNALQDKGKLDEALEAYNKARAIKPESAEIYNNMGSALQDHGKLEEAIEAYKKALLIKPDYADAYYNMGNAFKNRGKLEEAIEAYNKAIAIKPDYADAYNNMGLAFQEKDHLDTAILALQKAISLKPDYAEAYTNMGNALQDQRKLGEAIEAYSKATSIRPGLSDAWSNGADALEKWNELDQLKTWLEKAFNSFEVVPADLRYMKAKLLWRAQKFEETSKLLSDIKFEAISEIRKANYLNLKANCFEKSKKFEEAYDCFVRSNSLVKLSNEYLSCDPENYFKNLKEKLCKLRSRSHKKSKIEPQENLEFNPTFLVGFPRSGTTLLDTILRSHSKINVIEEKPLRQTVENFLNKKGYHDFIMQFVPSNFISKAQKVYEEELKKHIEKPTANSVFIDKLPLNLLQAPLIHQLYPDAKFILALRHPMDTILSCWMQNFKLNEAMANMVDLERTVDFYCIAMETFKICRTNYNLNVHEIRYEDLINNFQRESESVAQFLNLQWEAEMENYQNTAINRGRINTPSYSQVVQPIYKDAQYRWINYRKYLRQYLPQIKPWISEFGYD